MRIPFGYRMVVSELSSRLVKNVSGNRRSGG